MSYVRIWLHCVWTTKNRYAFLKDEVRYQVISHIAENAQAKNIYIDCINGYYQHLHALISLGATQNVSDVMQKIKGESSYWINKNNLTKLKFGWQDDFYCVSLGVPQLGHVRKYIQNQEGHHCVTSLEEEIEKLIKENDLQLVKG